MWNGDIYRLYANIFDDSNQLIKTYIYIYIYIWVRNKNFEWKDILLEDLRDENSSQEWFLCD